MTGVDTPDEAHQCTMRHNRRLPFVSVASLGADLVGFRADEGDLQHCIWQRALESRSTGGVAGKPRLELFLGMEDDRHRLRVDGLNNSVGPAGQERHRAGRLAACREVPEVNAALDGRSVIVYDEVNVAVGVDTEHGLAAPVVHGADRMGLQELAGEIRRLAEAARRRKLTFEDIGGATITTSNLGPRGVDFGTPIISLNTAATIYFGTIAERPMVVDGRVVAGPTFYVSGAFDHRVVDGATGARYLRALGAILESE